MNLLMIGGDSLIAQGVVDAQYAMLEHFSRYWSRIDIICTGSPHASSRIVHKNVHVHPSPYPKWLHPYYVWKKGATLAAERPYSLIVSHDFGLFYTGIGAFILSRTTRIPCVSEIHHLEGYPVAATLRERVYRLAARLYLPWAAKRVAAMRAVNRVEVPELLRKMGVSADKILILPAIYLDHEIFHPLAGVEPIYDVLFVGRLTPNKGLFTLLDAIYRIKELNPSIQLGIRGDGPLRSAIESRIAVLRLWDNITLIPRMKNFHDMARLFNQSRMLVCASTSEGGPRVVVEAMACGIPIISTPVGVMIELIEDGVNGLLFHWDADQLAGKIGLLLNDANLRLQLGERGYESVQNLSAEKTIQAYALGYHALIKRLEQNSP